MSNIDPFWTGKTFDDFLFRPQKSITRSRRDINLSLALSSSINLHLPIISSNMDSVTSASMARVIASEGGMGVIHRGMSIARQASEVSNVKRSQSAIIEQPLCLPVSASVKQARAFRSKHSITGILIETAVGSGILAGLLSNRDMPWDRTQDHQSVEHFMTPVDKLITAHPGICTSEASQILYQNRIERLPLVDEQNRIMGLITSKDIASLTARPFANNDEKGKLIVAAAVGAHGDYLERTAALIEAGADCLFVDIAHGHSVVMETAITELRKHYGNVLLVAGNIASYEGARFMRDIGVDAIKVGIGPGKGCRTRLETAAGVPQLQAINEAWQAVGDEIPIIADGGVRTDKDIFLALIAGASSVMLGSALSGTDEAPGHVIVDPVTHMKKKIYRGMTSPQAVFGAMDDDHDGESPDIMETPAEGQEMQVPYKGSVVDILHRIRGHLRSSVSYAGENELAAARKKVLEDPARYLIALSEASRIESYER